MTKYTEFEQVKEDMNPVLEGQTNLLKEFCTNDKIKDLHGTK